MSVGLVKVLVLTSSTGGGHDSRARAFRAWTEKDAGRWDVHMHQALEETHGVYRLGVGIYNVIQRTWPRLHHIYFNVLEAVSFCGGKGGVMGGDVFQETVRRVRPDLILSTHDHLNHGFFVAARAALADSPPQCATYCTELCGGYGFSRHWVNPEADLFIGATAESCAQARALGMAEDKIFHGGFLLDPAFWEKPAAARDDSFVREELKLQPGAFTLLLSTGANSAQNHLAWLEALARAAPFPAPMQVVALCGGDDDAKSSVQSWAAAHPRIPVRALGKFPNLAQLLRVAGAVVARPGTGTTSEGVLAGVPILFNTTGGIMPQEMITVKFARAHGFGHVLSGPGDLAGQVRRWLADPVVHAAERARMAAACPACTPADILNRLRGLAREGE